MADKTPTTQVEAATDEKTPEAETSNKPTSLTTTIWAPGKTLSIDALRNQAVINTRDAVPVAAYDRPSIKVTGTKAKTVNKIEGTLWEVAVEYTKLVGAPKETVDLEKLIKESQAGYGDTHPGDPDFLTREQR